MPLFDQAKVRFRRRADEADGDTRFAGAPGAPANDLLISMGCNVVVSRTFSWPHPATGMKPSTVGDLSEILTKIFPQGT